MTPSYIRKRAKDLEKLIAESEEEARRYRASLLDLRKRCLHPNAETRVFSENCYEGRSYKYDYCPDCGIGKEGY
jgi:hypothetical protein